MRRLKTLLLLSLVLPMSVLAAGTAFVVVLNNGNTASFLLQEDPVMTFEGSKLIITTGTVHTDFERADIKEFTFTGNSTDVKAVPQKNLVYKQTDAEHLEISGLDAGTTVSIYDMAGQQVGSVSRMGDKAVVSLSGKQKGIYLIQVGTSQTIKFIKK